MSWIKYNFGDPIELEFRRVPLLVSVSTKRENLVLCSVYHNDLFLSDEHKIFTFSQSRIKGYMLRPEPIEGE